jgi:hypothetical protein
MKNDRVDSYNQMAQKKATEVEVNPRKVRKGKHDDDYGTFKIGGDNREIKKRTYDDYTNSLVINPTREGGNQGIGMSNNGPMVRGKSQQRPNYNIINHTQSEFNGESRRGEVMPSDRDVYSHQGTTYNPRENVPNNYGQQNIGYNPREGGVPNNYQSYGSEEVGSSNTGNPYNVNNNYNYQARGNNDYINQANNYNPNTYEGRSGVPNNEGSHLENYEKHYEPNPNAQPDITEEQYQKYYQEYLNSMREKNTKELFEKDNPVNHYGKPQEIPYESNYPNELAYEMGKMNLGNEQAGNTNQQNEYTLNKNNSMKGNNIHNIPETYQQGSFDSRVDNQKNYRDYLDSQVKST